MNVAVLGFAPAGTTEADGWRSHLAALGLAVTALLALFARDVRDMATIWWTSSTFEHCLVILPIIGWLVWQRAAVLARVEPAGWGAPLLWVAAGALGWLVGEAAGVAVPRQLGLVMMMQGAVAAILGRGVTAGLIFPLFYAIFLVPMGDAVVPALQTLTARMCLALLHLAHIPATIDGVFITTPAGWFKVAEACSGAKFLIAMIALGVLVAHLGFLRWPRRIAFLCVCLATPVLANGLRAFGTIWFAQYRGAKAASGFDHVVYGWIFFALVIAAVLAVSWRRFDRAADAVPVDAAMLVAQAARQGQALSPSLVALAVLAIAAAPPLWSRIVRAQGTAALPPIARMPDVPGWSRVPETGTVWRPRFDGADRLVIDRYRDADGRLVDFAIAVYSWQGEGRTLVGYAHGAVDPAGDWAWAANLPAPQGALGERIVGPGQEARDVASLYRVGRVLTGSPVAVKLATLKGHLLGGEQRAAALLISSPEVHGGMAAIADFMAALGPAGPAIDRIAGGR